MFCNVLPREHVNWFLMTPISLMSVADLCLNPLNTELSPICHLLALLGAHHTFHVSGLRVNGDAAFFCEV